LFGFEFRIQVLIVVKSTPLDAEILRWLLSMSVRFVSSKKEKGEKHQRRSHNAEAESQNEHRVERGVVGH
jgi:hypothetical protein